MNKKIEDMKKYHMANENYYEEKKFIVEFSLDDRTFWFLCKQVIEDHNIENDIKLWSWDECTKEELDFMMNEITEYYL